MRETHVKSDHQWLHKWSSHISGKRVLELGCGSGTDTDSIANLTDSLVTCDVRPAEGLKKTACGLILDHSRPLPFEKSFDVVVASLCLHYFDWTTTENIIVEISRILVNKGVLLCRLNSDQDINYGARGFPEIEPGLFDVNGADKRFFDQQSIVRLFTGHWQLTELHHKSIDRYRMSKSIWEFGAINAQQMPAD